MPNASVVHFTRIAERVVRTDYAGDGEIEVEYEPGPPLRFTVGVSPLKFVVDMQRNLLLRLEGEVKHRPPYTDMPAVSAHKVTFEYLRVNQSLDPNAFHFEPPPDATMLQGSGCLVGGSL